jgi:hypothetical protein
VFRGTLSGEDNLSISEKFCPVCKNVNDREALICVHCGSLLDNSPGDARAEASTTSLQMPSTEKTRELHLSDATVPASGIAIYVEGLPNPVFLYTGEQFVVGRNVGGTSDALLDLSPLGGYHLGLSRRHVMIRRTKEGYEVLDLSSSNGTWLNGERLIPKKPYPLGSASQLRLGRMRLYVLYRSPAQNQEKS